MRGEEQAQVLAIAGARIYTMAGRPFDQGVLLVEGGKVADVGPDVRIPEGAQVIRAEGQLMTPGIIDAHTHLGISEEGIGFEGADYNESTDPVAPHLRAIDGINPEEEGMREACSGGVTTVCIAPGSANVVGGECIVLKTFGKVVDKMVVRNPAGLKVAFGENPKRVYHEQKKMPVTRMGTAALLREALVSAGNYAAQVDKGQKDPDKMPDRDLRMEALLRVLRREAPLRAHAHRADDIMTAIRIAEEFNVDLIIEHATEAYKIAGELASRGIPAIVGPALGSKPKVELKDMTIKAPGMLVEAGVRIALMTDHPVIPIQYLPLCAAVAVREGLSWDDALKALTINPAEILSIADRVGSLEKGKDADVVVWSGDPLDARSEIEIVLVNGIVAYKRDRDGDMRGSS